MCHIWKEERKKQQHQVFTFEIAVSFSQSSTSVLCQ